MIRVRTVFTGVAGSPYYSNLYFANASAEAQEDAAERVRLMWAELTNELSTPLQAQVESTIVTMDPATGDISSSLEVAPLAPVQYTNANERLPLFTQLLVTFKTGQFANGRELRGRMFIPGWTTADNSAIGRPESGTRANVLTVVNAFIAGDPALQVWSRKNGTIAPVTGISVGTEWSVLRSRRD